MYTGIHNIYMIYIPVAAVARLLAPAPMMPSSSLWEVTYTSVTPAIYIPIHIHRYNNIYKLFGRYWFTIISYYLITSYDIYIHVNYT